MVVDGEEEGIIYKRERIGKSERVSLTKHHSRISGWTWKKMRGDCVSASTDRKALDGHFIDYTKRF